MTYSMLQCSRLLLVSAPSQRFLPPLFHPRAVSSSQADSRHRCFSVSRAHQAQDFRSQLDRTVINTESDEYSQTASDDDAAQRDDAFNPHITSPPCQESSASPAARSKDDDGGSETGSLAVSPAQRSMSHVPPEKEIDSHRNEGLGVSRQGKPDKSGTGKIEI